MGEEIPCRFHADHIYSTDEEDARAATGVWDEGDASVTDTIFAFGVGRGVKAGLSWAGLVVEEADSVALVANGAKFELVFEEGDPRCGVRIAEDNVPATLKIAEGDVTSIANENGNALAGGSLDAGQEGEIPEAGYAVGAENIPEPGDPRVSGAYRLQGPVVPGEILVEVIGVAVRT